MFEQVTEAALKELQGETQTKETASAENADAKSETTAQESQPSKFTELDKLEKFVFEGKEWTPKDLKNAILMQSDYTRKTQEIAEQRKTFEQDRKYYDNLPHDLALVWQRPELMNKFKEMYPERFHSYLDILEKREAGTSAQQTEQREQLANLPPEFLQKLERIESYVHEQEVQKSEAMLDAIFQKNSAKFPYANEEQVLARAQALRAQGTKLSDSVWDDIFKTIHESNEKQFLDWQKKLNQTQLDANKRGKDIGSGGGTPGQAPKRLSFKEATELAIQEAKAARS